MDAKDIIYNVRRNFYRGIDYIAFNKKFDLTEAIAVYGPPRSGTTWVMDVINQAPVFLTVFEPLFDSLFPEIAPWFEGRPYKPKEAVDEEYRDILYRVFTGKSPAFDPVIRMHPYDIFKRFSATRLLIKFCRGNRLLPWLSNQFNFSKSYLLFRHPCALISSQMQSGFFGYGWGKNLSLEQIIKEIQELDFIEDKTLEKVKSIKSLEAKLAVMYALDYIVPITMGNNDFTPIFYEKLMINPQQEYQKIFEEIGTLDYLKRGLKIAEKPSGTTKSSEKNALSDAHYQVRKWSERMSQKQISEIEEVLGWFDITFSTDGYDIMGLKTYYK